jgi:hypothetical protein
MAKPKAEVRPKKAADKAESTGANRRKVDWEAVERDYRASQMTLRELGAKHGCDHSAIKRKADKLQWSRDLGSAVRQATNAALIESTVTSVANKAQQGVTNAVLAAAEVNKQVILSHRERLRQMQADADLVRWKLLEMVDMVSDVKEAATLVGAFEASARTGRIVIEAERKAFGLDEVQPEEAKQSDEAKELGGRFDAFEAKLEKLSKGGNAPA